jgi:lipoprotein-anchoring transpeptidase ErfK/SrfK
MTPTTHDRTFRGRPALVSVLICAGLLALVPVSTAANVGSSHSASPATTERIAHPLTVSLISPKLAHWAPVVSQIAARRAPSRAASVVTQLNMMTGDGTQNILLLLKEKKVSPSQDWYEVRLPILPNNSVGWVPRSALGNIYTVNTHLYVNRENQTLVLKRNGVPIFTTRVGVGRTYWPTPAGQFYIRDKLMDFGNPFYGPIAFGTSARSAVLTDWPGGGFVGVHGTNEPGLIPGHISHGCIRLVNSAIVRLAQLMSVGTPLTIT